MAICRYCCEDMLGATGCTVAVYDIGGEALPRVRYGKEWSDCLDRCGDCGVLRGEYHHPGCDIERCPRCWGQALSCWCREDEPFAAAHEALEEGWYATSPGGLGPPGSGADDGTAVIDLFTRRATTAGPVPFDAVRPGLRARTGDRVDALVAWAATTANDVEPDAALLAYESLAPHVGLDGQVIVRRPDVVRAMRRCQLLTEDQKVAVPLGVASTMAAIILHGADTGRLDERSDRVEHLLEPLHAHFALSLRIDGEHRCECFAPHDPDCGPDARLLPVRSGHVVATRVPETAPAGFDTEQPLRLFADRLDILWGGREPISLGDLSLLGWLPADGRRPRLWVHGRADDAGRYDALPLDDGGRAHVARADRRCRTGYRWEQVSALDARWLCHLGEPPQPPSMPVTWTIET